MTKNKLEKLFSKSFRADTDFWGLKLHNNPLAHQNTPADYILSYGVNPVVGDILFSDIFPKLILVECKQCDNDRIPFSRLKQTHDLLAFERNKNFHYSYYLIAFYEGQWTKSLIYLIPIELMNNQIINQISSGKVSFNSKEMYSKFSDYIIDINKGLLNLNKLKQS